MKKIDATAMLGGTDSAAANEIGITPQAYGQWPDILPRRLEDRVLAALYRRQHPNEGTNKQDVSHA